MLRAKQDAAAALAEAEAAAEEAEEAELAEEAERLAAAEARSASEHHQSISTKIDDALASMDPETHAIGEELARLRRVSVDQEEQATHLAELESEGFGHSDAFAARQAKLAQNLATMEARKAEAAQLEEEASAEEKTLVARAGQVAQEAAAAQVKDAEAKDTLSALADVHSKAEDFAMSGSDYTQRLREERGRKEQQGRDQRRAEAAAEAHDSVAEAARLAAEQAEAARRFDADAAKTDAEAAVQRQAERVAATQVNHADCFHGAHARCGEASYLAVCRPTVSRRSLRQSRRPPRWMKLRPRSRRGWTSQPGKPRWP
jgi:hypothetical protein